MIGISKMTTKQKFNRLFTLLIALLAILLVIASLFVRSPWVGYLSWGLMALSLGVTLVTLIQNERRRFGEEPGRFQTYIKKTAGGTGSRVVY